MYLANKMGLARIAEVAGAFNLQFGSLTSSKSTIHKITWQLPALALTTGEYLFLIGISFFCSAKDQFNLRSESLCALSENFLWDLDVEGYVWGRELHLLPQQALQTGQVLIVNEFWVDHEDAFFSSDHIGGLDDIPHLAVFKPFSVLHFQKNVFPACFIRFASLLGHETTQLFISRALIVAFAVLRRLFSETTAIRRAQRIFWSTIFVETAAAHFLDDNLSLNFVRWRDFVCLEAGSGGRKATFCWPWEQPLTDHVLLKSTIWALAVLLWCHATRVLALWFEIFLALQLRIGLDWLH